MMNRKNMDIGRWGEKKAAEYLERKGYELLEQNFRCRAGELDLILRKDQMLCIAEVKTRCSMNHGLPCESIDARKRQHIRRVARYYMMSHGIRERNQEVRFDVIELLVLGEKVYLNHIENAF